MGVAQKAKVRRFFLVLFFTSLFSLNSLNYSFASDLVHKNANSSYVLPYPSAMPGSSLYKINLVKDEILKYWYFGNFGQFKYNLKLADKYLVESKTLFEYGQYLLAIRALHKSDDYFRKTEKFLSKAKSEGKNIEVNRSIQKNSAKKHIEVLKKISQELPENFEWNPEKDKPSSLHLRKEINNSISTREKFL